MYGLQITLYDTLIRLNFLFSYFFIIILNWCVALKKMNRNAHQKETYLRQNPFHNCRIDNKGKIEKDI